MSFSFNLREQIIIGAALLVLITVIFGVFVFKPQFDKFNDARKRQEQEIQEQNARKEELKNLKDAKKDAAKTEARSLSLSRRMPEEADLPSILVELDNAGRETNIKVLDITPAEAITGSGYSNLPIELKIVGSFFNIADFLYKIVKLPREYTVGTVDISLAEDGYPLLEGSIKLKTFVYTPNSADTNAQSNAQSNTSQSNEKQQEQN
ncbi:MAG: hypothetical protein E3J54_05110 [Actinobacteria bacterium]|nr:MAG: hypothetical protein E3J54_05110 [Actinomycetota bacterium]